MFFVSCPVWLLKFSYLNIILQPQVIGYVFQTLTCSLVILYGFKLVLNLLLPLVAVIFFYYFMPLPPDIVGRGINVF